MDQSDAPVLTKPEQAIRDTQLALEQGFTSGHKSVLRITNQGGVDVDSVSVQSLTLGRNPVTHHNAGFVGAADQYIAELPRGKTEELLIAPADWINDLRAHIGKNESPYLFTVRVQARVLRKSDAREFSSCGMFVLNKNGTRFERDDH